MHAINLTVGDPGGDGHGQSETTLILSNITPAEVKAAYKAGAAVIGVDLVSTVCVEYEDKHLKAADWAKFVAAGATVESIGCDIETRAEYDRQPGDASLWTDSFTALYLFTVAIGAKSTGTEFIYEVAHNSDICIGGYGIYST